MVSAAYIREDSLINFFLLWIVYHFSRLVGFANHVNCGLELSVEDIVHLGGVSLDLVHLEDCI